jgi:hypothetical protein
MISRNHLTRFASFAAGVLVCGIAGLQAAHAQDSVPPGEPSATPVADPNAPPPGAYPAPPPGGAMPAIGARLSDQFSFNGELLFDLENISNVPPGASESAYFVQFAAAPLFHLQASPTAEIVMGPKLGLFVEHASLSGYGLDVSGNAEGLLVGVNLGAFFRISDALSLGGLINFDYMRQEWCSNEQGDCTTSDDGLKVISFTGAAQF